MAACSEQRVARGQGATQAAAAPGRRERFCTRECSYEGTRPRVTRSRCSRSRSVAISTKPATASSPRTAAPWSQPISTAKIEDLIGELRKNYTIVIVTHNMQQAARISDFTAFFYEGVLIEYGPTEKIFTNPSLKKTEDYVTGRFG